uniref:Uncharacterized protein n=1 Tax=Rhizophora mucronata TaxID=61149 RepID=A0A2P2Q3X3_RHIMU
MIKIFKSKKKKIQIP